MPAQEPHPPPAPLTARVSPLPPLLIAENREMARDVRLLPQRVHGAAESALLIGRSISKVDWQSAQLYS
ncbi:MAG: hypothetical protein PVF77_05365 [Anaerolineae bacterium]